MEWTQVLTIVGVTVGSTYAFFMIVREDMNQMREDMIRLDNKFEEKFVKMDEKWERLFERLLLKEQTK